MTRPKTENQVRARQRMCKQNNHSGAASHEHTQTTQAWRDSGRKDTRPAVCGRAWERGRAECAYCLWTQRNATYKKKKNTALFQKKAFLVPKSFSTSPATWGAWNFALAGRSLEELVPSKGLSQYGTGCEKGPLTKKEMEAP